MNLHEFPPLGFIPLTEQEAEERVATLRSEMEQHQGELVSVTAKSWSFNSMYRGFTDDKYVLEQRSVLGVVTPPFMEVRNGLWLVVHTPKFAHVDTGRYGDMKIYTSQGPIGPHYPLLTPGALGVPMQELRGRHSLRTRYGDPGLALEVLVGDQAVAERFQSRADVLVEFYRLQKALGKPPVPLAPEFQARLDEAVARKKAAILIEIERLNLEERQLLVKIGRTQSVSIPRVRFPLDDASYEIQVRKDEQDLRRIAVFPVMEQLDRIRGSIAKQKQEAASWDI